MSLVSFNNEVDTVVLDATPYKILEVVVGLALFNPHGKTCGVTRLESGCGFVLERRVAFGESHI
jgi:hypothetical protein